MMDNDNNLIIPEIEDHETNKYRKNVNAIIENAEIEAEIEAEKKIRSKNSRIFLISMFGLAFISMVYFQINKKTGTSNDRFTAPIESSINAGEVKLAKHTTVLDENSIISTPPINTTKALKNEKQTTPAKKLTTTLKPKNKSNQNNKKIIKTAKIKQIGKVTFPKSNKPKNSFFVQTGAFSLEENAKKLVKNLKTKGFNPSIHFIANGSKKFYLVQLGVFQNKEKAKQIQKKLTKAGYSKTIIK